MDHANYKDYASMYHQPPTCLLLSLTTASQNETCSLLTLQEFCKKCLGKRDNQQTYYLHRSGKCQDNALKLIGRWAKSQGGLLRLLVYCEITNNQKRKHSFIERCSLIRCLTLFFRGGGCTPLPNVVFLSFTKNLNATHT